jgi:hypothetical protein
MNRQARGDSSQPALRAPGQYARERGLELSLRPVLIAMLALFAMLIAWRGIGLRGVPLVIFELGAIGTMVSADRLYSDLYAPRKRPLEQPSVRATTAPARNR